MPDTLVQILPPLRQSAVEVASCPKAYVSIYLEGRHQPDSIPSERGQEVHSVMSRYVRHCATRGIASDWAYFDSLTRAAGPVAGPMLDGIRDRYVVDYAHVYDTEVTLALDEEFHPTDHTPDRSDRFLFDPGVEYSPNPAAYTGTLDTIFLSEDATAGTIRDYKTHPSVFDADSFQGKLYALMLFQHLPTLEVVQFELVFVRYINCTRSVQYRREDIPALRDAVSRARERQRLTHENPDQAKALPCSTCAYCPLAKRATDCPISEWNEYTALTAEQRVMLKVWMAQMAKINNRVLRELAEVNGPVRYQDGNGEVYEYAEQPVPSTRAPLDATLLHVLREYQTATGEDLLDGRLNVSTTKLNQLLKTRKREGLREVFESSIFETSTKPKYAVRTPEGLLEEGHKEEE